MASFTTPPTDPPLDLRLESAGPGGASVLGPLHLRLEPGETVALTGPSGVGKSTLLRVIAGLEPHFIGTRQAADRIAMVFQEPVLLPWRTALQNITLIAGCNDAAARGWLEAVGLAGMENRLPGQLSLGQQRRLSLARAFAAAPELLLLDEPFVSLDPALADEMMTLLERLSARHPVTTLLVTHAPEEARRLAERVLRLEGRPARLVGAG